MGLAFAVLVVIEVLPAYALIILLFMPAKISVGEAEAGFIAAECVMCDV